MTGLGRCYERAEVRLERLQQRAAAGDETADQLAERILTDLRESEAARRADLQLRNEAFALRYFAHQAHARAEIEAA